MEMDKQVILHNWFVWPAKQQPVRAGIAWVIVAIGIILAMQTSTLLGIGIAIAFLMSVGEILLPSTYVLTTTGVEIRSIHKMTKKRWETYVGWRTTDKGIYLIGKGNHRFLIQRRSMMVYCFSDRDKIISIIVKYIPPQKDDQT